MHMVFALVTVVFVTTTVFVGITNAQQNAYNSILAEAQQWQRANPSSCGRDVSDCGIAKMVDNFQSCGAFRIFNGCAVEKPLTVGWQAALLTKGGKYDACNGVLIGPQHILAAAHCLLRIESSDSIKIALGVGNNKNVRTSQLLEVSAFGVHPKYDSSAGHDFDVALIKLKQSVSMNEANGIRAACLPTAEFETPTHKLCLLAGFGTSSAIANSTDGLGELRYTLVRKQNKQKCRYSKSAVLFCTLGERNSQRTGTCAGDSGSALLCTDDSSRWIVTGIAAYASSGNCARSPNGFADVAKLGLTIPKRVAVSDAQKQKCKTMANTPPAILSMPAAGNLIKTVLCKPQNLAGRRADFFWNFKINATHPLCRQNLPKTMHG